MSEGGPKTHFHSRTPKKEVKKEGEGIAEIVKNRDKTIVPAGFFKIKEKKLNEETQEYEYKFEWDEKFGRYASLVLDMPDGVSPENMDIFCYNILLAEQTDQLEDGVKVEHVNKKREKEEKNVKFFKKY